MTAAEHQMNAVDEVVHGSEAAQIRWSSCSRLHLIYQHLVRDLLLMFCVFVVVMSCRTFCCTPSQLRQYCHLFLL